VKLIRYILIIIALAIVWQPSGTAWAAPHSFWASFDLAGEMDMSLFEAFPGVNPKSIDMYAAGLCAGHILNGCFVSSEYGWRTHPKRRRHHFHTGIDLAAPKGQYIYAAADGVVKVASRRRGYGKMVELDHGYAWQTLNGHMSKIYVKKGQIVKRGDIIGEVGSTGVSTGPHLHFEIKYFGSAVNPRHYFSSLQRLKEPAFHFANR